MGGTGPVYSNRDKNNFGEVKKSGTQEDRGYGGRPDRAGAPGGGPACFEPVGDGSSPGLREVRSLAREPAGHAERGRKRGGGGHEEMRVRHKGRDRHPRGVGGRRLAQRHPQERN